MFSKLKPIFLISALFLLLQPAFPQSEQVEQVNPKGDTIVLKPIGLSQVTKAMESDYKLLKIINERITETGDFVELDSILENKVKFLTLQKDLLEKEKETFSIREVRNNMSEWLTYEKQINSLLENINERIQTVEEDLYTVRTRRKIWELTKDESRKLQAPQSVISGINDAVKAIKQTEKKLKKLHDELLQRQSSITNELLEIKNVQDQLKSIEEVLRSEYFSVDSPPLWNSYDSTLTSARIKVFFTDAVKENLRSIRLFSQINNVRIFFHIIFFLLLWLAFYLLQKQLVIISSEEDEHLEILEKSEKAIAKNSLSALVIALFTSIWIYPNLSSTVVELIQLIYLVVAIIFFPSYMGASFRKPLYAILGLFFLNQLQIFFPEQMILTRVLLLVETLLSTWVVYILLNKEMVLYKELIKNRLEFIVKILYSFYIFLAAAVVANLFGYVRLSTLFSNTVVNGIINLVVILLVVIMVNRSIIILLRTKIIRKSNYINNHWQLVEKRLTQAVFIVAIFLWIKSILRHLNLLDSITKWLENVGNTTWEVGNSTIALRGILDFFLVIILTYLFYSVIKALLKEEFFPRVKLPRGVPGAISMITGYVIVAYGIYLALSAAGVDLSQFGLIAGALGVGIGFGLQNIIANFIAGLILAFERPIQVGDTIEAGQVMGDVKTIGVRACTIRTFDGSEVMIPNINLISNDVINWTLSDRKKRRDIYVSVAYGSNPREVMAILKKVAEANPNVLQVPAPWILFEGFGESSLNFRVRVWTSMDTGLTTKSEVAIAIYDALNEARIEIPFPQHDLHIRSIETVIPVKQQPTKTQKPKEK